MSLYPDTICAPLPRKSDRNLVTWMLAWLSQPSRATTKSLASLTDDQLRDIGIEPGQLTIPKIAEPERIGLLDLGWQPPRPRRRR